MEEQLLRLEKLLTNLHLKIDFLIHCQSKSTQRINALGVKTIETLSGENQFLDWINKIIKESSIQNQPSVKKTDVTQEKNQKEDKDLSGEKNA